MLISDYHMLIISSLAFLWSKLIENSYSCYNFHVTLIPNTFQLIGNAEVICNSRLTLCLGVV